MLEERHVLGPMRTHYDKAMLDALADVDEHSKLRMEVTMLRKSLATR